MPELQQIRFNGLMDLDSTDEQIAVGSHKYANNIVFYGNRGFMTAQNIPGNILVPNAALPNTGTNICIGGFYDQVKKMVIFFNYNSGGKNGIYSYDLATNTITKIFLCFTDSATDILFFSPNFPVHSAAIVYRSASDGDLLYWTDENNRPRYLNLSTVPTLAPFLESMINAGKNAPPRRPSVSYGNDLTVNVNNLRKQLFRFRYRWGYANLEKSTWSPISIVPLPVDGFTPDTQNSSTTNNNIAVILFAGGTDTVSLDLAVQVNNGTTWSDFFFVETFKMSDYGIVAGGAYTYKFYNDGAYPAIDVKETDLYYSYLPDKANTLEVLNGNVIIYGGITDGYPKMSRSAINVNITSGTANPNIPSISFNFTQESALVVGIGSVITAGATYHISFDYISGGVPGNKSVNYVTLLGDTATTVATSLAALLNGAPVSATAASSTIRISVGGVAPSISNVAMSVSLAGSESAAASWLWSCNEQLALIYFDDRMKPVAIVTFTTASTDTTDFAVTTSNFTTVSNIPQVPFLAAQINHLAPSGTTTFQWLRATKVPKFLHWVTNDYQTDTNFIYFCIQNLDYTKTKLDGYVPSYELVKGDRIRIMAAYNSVSGVKTPYNIQLDMEILGEEQRTMGGPNTATLGRFLKCAKPATFPSVPYTANMFIQVYTPQFNFDTDKQLYFEWGQQYSIINVATTIINYTTNFGVFQVGEKVKEAVTNAEGTVVSVSPTQLVIIPTLSAFVGGLTFTGLTSGASGNCISVAVGSTIRYHEGQIQNQSVNVPATYQWYDGDVYYKNRTFYLSVGDLSSVVSFMMDANYSDYFPSAVNSNGRGWVVDPNAATIYRSTQLRWGQSYQQDTNINKLNIFYPDDFDTADLGKGAIRRLKTRNRILRVFQERGCGQLGVYSKFIQDSGNTRILETSDTIITTNNIQYYEGEFGVGTQPSSLVSGKIQDYFCDPVRGYQCRLSGDGIIPISELYKGQFFIRDLLTPYNHQITKSNGFTSFITGTYDYLNEEYIAMLPGGTYSGTTYPPYLFTFNELRNGYSSFFDDHPEWITNCGEIVVTFKDGNLYTRNSNTYCNFYGVQYNCDLQIPFNQNLLEKKTWLSQTQITNNGSKWSCPSIYTNSQSYGSQRQESLLIDSDFSVLEGNPSASFLRDANSIGGILNGDILKGNLIVVTFRKVNASSLINLNEVAVLSRDSPLTSH